MNKDLHFPTENEPRENQSTPKEYVNAVMNEYAIRYIKEMAEATDPSLQQNAKEAYRIAVENFKRATENIERIQPFMDLIFAKYPDDAWFMAFPLQVTTFPIQAYMASNGLEDGTGIEAHSKPFLDFFEKYITALEKAYQEKGKALDLGDTQRELLEGFKREGLINTLSEFMPITPDFIYGPDAIMPTSVLIKKQVEIAKANGNPRGLDVGGNGEENAKVEASITTDKEISSGAVEVQNVIGELMQANGNKPISITKAQLYRAFAYMPNKAKVPDKALEFIGETIEVLRDAEGRIDFTQQVEKHKKLKRDKSYDYSNAILEGKLVLADKKTLIAGGHKTEGYIFYRLPLFYMHSHLTNQITRIDRALLDTTADKITDGTGKKHKVEARQNNIPFILLKRYLAREVEAIKSNKGKPNNETRRNFETIAKAIDLHKPVKDKNGNKTEPGKLTDRQIRTLRENVEFLCNRWVIQGNIKGYRLYKNRGSQAFVGVDIEV